MEEKIVKLNRKINAFGKSIPVIFIILMLLTTGIAGAMLVTHLSNTVTADVTVTSPIVQEISDGVGSGWTNTITISPACGGETVTFYTRETNMADATITGFSENIVTCQEGVTPGDFKSAFVSTNNEPQVDLLPFCEQGNNLNTVVFTYPVMIWEAKQVDTNQIEVTFADGAVGTYTLTCQIMVP